VRRPLRHLVQLSVSDHLTFPSVNRLVLRLYNAAPTPLDPVLPSSQHLEPPPLARNFLISPPGSPPLAHDLMAALERLSSRAAKGEKEVIIQEDVAGVGVTVQDMTPDADFVDEDAGPRFDPSQEIFESEEGRRRSTSIGQVRATVDSMGGGAGQDEDESLFGGAGDAFAGTPLCATPVGDFAPRTKGKITPTAMPPMPMR
jgi:hypothetical protein